MEKEKSMSRFDVAIIGTGPAGLEAAITAKVRNKNIVLYGSKLLSNKMQVVDHPILNYLGLPSVTGKQMAEAFQKQLDEMGIEVTEQKVTTVYAMGDYYTLQLGNGDMVEASSVILATGVVAGKPYPGEEKFLGRGVSYCATCDAPLYRGKVVACIGGSKEEEAEADFLGEVCEKVYYLPLYKDEPSFAHVNVEVIKEKPKEISGAMKAKALVTEQNTYDVDCVFILRAAQFPGQLVPGLETEGNAVKVDLQMKTNLPGLFAAGDIAGQPYQYIKSAGQGNVAALSAVSYLDEMKRKQNQ
ncbi:MAG: FAD-dependent oxidoreductase [Solobacterium sp.]|nr:FAD-dependent oxidoreductase [Solobacterium sp.]